MELNDFHCPREDEIKQKAITDCLFGRYIEPEGASDAYLYRAHHEQESEKLAELAAICSAGEE